MWAIKRSYKNDREEIKGEVGVTELQLNLDFEKHRTSLKTL